MDAQDFRGCLPLRLDRIFSPWSYELRRRTLVLRSAQNFEFGETVLVSFRRVVGMQVKDFYPNLLISEAGGSTDIDQFVELEDRFDGRYMRLLVGDENSMGFVVCASVDIRRDMPS